MNDQCVRFEKFDTLAERSDDLPKDAHVVVRTLAGYDTEEGLGVRRVTDRTDHVIPGRSEPRGAEAIFLPPGSHGGPGRAATWVTEGSSFPNFLTDAAWLPDPAQLGTSDARVDLEPFEELLERLGSGNQIALAESATMRE